MSAQKPRAAYCTGCGVTFKKMHLLIEHRRLFRCGGRYLSEEERAEINRLRVKREFELRMIREGRKIP